MPKSVGFCLGKEALASENRRWGKVRMSPFVHRRPSLLNGLNTKRRNLLWLNGFLLISPTLFGIYSLRKRKNNGTVPIIQLLLALWSHSSHVMEGQSMHVTQAACEESRCSRGIVCRRALALPPGTGKAMNSPYQHNPLCEWSQEFCSERLHG